MVIEEPADISGIVEEYGLQRHIAELQPPFAAVHVHQAEAEVCQVV